ncbi:MAG: acyl-CoA dehydrogenase family protein [Acidimicrobiia bacterium]|nr:acyl-CoA dehydrogenase family protein [Acidimicrobiia bacterium]
MDFTPSEEEAAIEEITKQILDDRATHERLRQLDNDGVAIDTEIWALLADAGVVGASLPTSHGGAGLGFMATAVALEQVGAHAAPIPLLSTVVLAGMPIAQFGTDAQRDAWLPGLADGSVIGTAALTEAGTTAQHPTTEATPTADGFVLHGVKTLVPDGTEADVILVPARLGDGTVAVFVVTADSAGMVRHRVDTTTGRPEARIVLDGVAVTDDDRLGGPGSDGDRIIDWLQQRANAGLCMVMTGAAQASIELAADYTKQRQQFDRPIATFQAVTQRAGDSFIDTEGIRLTALQAAWRLDAGLPAAREVQIARYWAAEAGYRVVHAAVHVHGGVGVDRDYPLHRHFLLARQLELTLGNSEEHLSALGAAIAAHA